jgi:predicted unusual protein kinase regulating ubiquinone biosynthesis (AarF/ABC1/UbiB family)
MGIEPARCGRRLMHACWWGFFESMFFSELPGASQIVVEPGGRLTFINLGNTGSLGQRHRRLIERALERISRHDVEGAVDLILQLLMPTPPIDLYDFTKALERRIWDGLFSLENPGRPWWERTGTALWLAILRTAREHGVPVRIELSRMMQSACLYDHLAARLWPRVRLLREFRRYRDQQHRREARATARDLDKRGGVDVRALTAQALKVARQMSLQLEAVIDNPPVRFGAVIQKAAYAASELLRMLLTWAAVGAFLGAVHLGLAWRASGRPDVVAAARWALGHAAFYAAGLILGVLTIRRVLFRLGDVDPRS